MAAQQSEKSTIERANHSGWALAEVKNALNFPVDCVNRSLLFSARLERDEKLYKRQIIRFLLDHK